MFLDGTLGGGGHTRLLAKLVEPTGSVVALDQDPGAVEAAEAELADLPVRAVQANYRDGPEVLRELGIASVNGMLLDLGLSSDQLADTSRGFSFSVDGPLDLRFNPALGQPAWRLVNRLSAQHLADLIYKYGEERFSRRIARNIVEKRRKSPIRSSVQLAELVSRCVPPAGRQQRIHPATRTFSIN